MLLLLKVIFPIPVWVILLPATLLLIPLLIVITIIVLFIYFIFLAPKRYLEDEKLD
nr:MAG TPA: hypothetical protein [Caudoviricetes sp.]